jgi:HEAT repeat protein
VTGARSTSERRGGARLRRAALAAVEVGVVALALLCLDRRRPPLPVPPAPEVVARDRAAVLPRMVAALHDEHPVVKWQAAQALRRFGPAAAIAIPDLRALVRDEGFGWRAWAAEALAAIGPEAAPAAMDIVPLLSAYDWHIHGAAGAAIARLGPAGVTALLVALGRGDPRARAAAATGLALGKILGDGSPPVLEDHDD